MEKEELGPILEELESIKKLLLMQAIRSSIPATLIAKALGVDKSAISRMVPVKEIKEKRE